MISETFATLLGGINEHRELILNGALGLLSIFVLLMLFRMQRLYRLVSDWVTYSPSPTEEKTAAPSGLTTADLVRIDESIEKVHREIASERNRVTALQKLFIETNEKSSLRLDILERSLAAAESRLSGRLDDLLRHPLPPQDNAAMNKERVPR